MRIFISLVPIFLLACATPQTQTSSTAPHQKRSNEELAKMYTELGTSALLRSDYSQAVADLRKGLAYDDDNAVAHNHLGLAYFALGKKDLAKTEIEAAVANDPKYSDAYINLGTLAYEAGNKAQAKVYYQKALDNLEYKLRHRALTNLAQIEFEENNIDRARQLLYQSLQANPDYCLSRFLLGSIFQREGNSERAAEEFKQSVAKTCVSNPEGHYQLGLAYMKVKQWEKARHEFVYLIREYPQTSQANKAGNHLKSIP